MFSLPVIIILKNVFSFYGTGSITTDLYVKRTDTHQYLLATSCHCNHTKQSEDLPILRICSNIETARSHCTELVDCVVKQGYDKRKTYIQIERAFSNVANPSTAHKCHATRPVYFNVQLHPALPDTKGILQKYMPLLLQSVTMTTVVTDLPIISFSQPPNLCQSMSG